MSDDHSQSRQGSVNNMNTTVAENVTLRIVILAHGNRREDDLYLVLSLDTTLEQLRNRIQESLPQRPPPSQQRIIYQGRGLENPNESLRTILRQDARAGNSSYVLHLVIRQVPAGSQPVPPASSTIQGHNLTNSPLQVHQPQDQRVQLPQISPHDAHMRIHNQIHQLQHSLQHQQAINRAQLMQAIPHLPTGTATGLNNARVVRSDNPVSLATGQLQAPGRTNTVPGLSSSQNPVTHHSPATGQTNQSSHSIGMTIPAPLQSQNPHPHTNQATTGSLPLSSTNATPMRTAMQSDGQHPRTIIDGGPTGTTTMTFRITGLNAPNPLNRPSSAPGASPSADAGPNNPVMNPVPGNIQIQTQPQAVPMGFPFPPGLQLPIPIPNMAPLLNNPFQHLMAPSSAAQPMAWLLSSPTGPHGIVFAPGHGYFNTAPVVGITPAQTQPTPTQAQNATPSTTAAPQQAQLIVRTQAGQGPSHAPQPGVRPHAADLPLPAQPRGNARRARARPNIDQNEILQFVLNRGWLFLRLYMFVFVFSESGTWRRILMIGAIIIYCALPQQNPLTDTLQLVRRHFDNLIGPPNIPQRPAQQAQRAQQNDQNPDQPGTLRATQPQSGASTSSRRRTAPMPTPEETARRLLEQQNRRNPNPVIDVLYRIEQGIVLFLASLVPGVGERHVRAREEARRIIQEEEQRRLADTQQQPQPQRAIEEGSSRPAGQSEERPETEGGPLPDGWKSATQLQDETNGPQATSSGVDRNGPNENEGVRSRTTNSDE